MDPARMSRRGLMRVSATAAAGAWLAAACSPDPSGNGSGSTGGDGAPVVSTSTGRVRGVSADGVHSFKGIPYAAPPVGELRFKAPRAAPNWDGELDASQLGHPSVQTNPDYSPWLDPQPESEDCLVLNVWAPEQVSERKPVMVWFHGGGYWYGSAGAPLYDGGNLARSGDVVVVGVNHRLNAFGYMWLGDIVPELADEGNVGQQDLVAALRWVQENIANFGGDPQNVTIFGESGGGGKVSSLLATPSAVGLFHRAIVQSGSAARLQTKEEASEAARLTLAALGPGPFDLKRLQSVKTEQLKAAAEAIGGQYGPVLDGSFMTHQTWARGAPPESSGIPMMIGYNTHEMVAFQPDFADPIPDDAELERRFRAVELVPVLSSEQYQTFLDGYRGLNPGLDRHRLLAAMSSDPVFMRLAKEQADIKAAQGARDVYVYEFTWTTPCFGGQWALHASELPLEFGNLSYASAWDGKDSDALRAAADPQDHQARLSAEMIAAWSAFARTGDPSTASLPWPAYDANTTTTMVLGGAESKAVPRFADQRYALVRDLPVKDII